MSARVLCNALALRPQGSGVQTYIRELLAHLAPSDAVTIRALVQADAVAGLPAGVTPLVAPRADGLRRAVHGLWPRSGVELVHGLNVALPLSPGVAKVVTVHDLSSFDDPTAMSSRKAAASRAHLRLAVRRADAVIAVSAFTASRLKDVLGCDATPVPLAPGPEFVPPGPAAVEAVVDRYRLPDRFVLHVGTVEPRKDTPRLVAACRQAGVPLVLAGAAPAGGAPALGDAMLLGWVPGDVLPALYGAAHVVAYPSRYEGFGIPPLEAMACGAAVVATDIPPLRETLAGAAELVPAGDTDALAGQLRALVLDDARRAELQAAGRRRAGCFSWERTAEQTLDVYRSLGVGL